MGWARRPTERRTHLAPPGGLPTLRTRLPGPHQRASRRRPPVCVLRPHRVRVWLWRWIAPASWDGWRSSRLPYFLKSVCEVGVISLSNVCWNSPARPWEPRSLVQARLLNRRGIFRLSTFLVLALVVFVFRGRGLSLSSKSWSRWREAAVLLPTPPSYASHQRFAVPFFLAYIATEADETSESFLRPVRSSFCSVWLPSFTWLRARSGPLGLLGDLTLLS